MECTCVRHTELPNTSKLFLDLIYQFERVKDLYPAPPNSIEALEDASHFDFPDDRRARVVEALAPMNLGNPSLARLAQPGTVAIVTGQQVGLFSGPAYTVYKALTAIRIAHELESRGVAAVPVFWLATEDHDFAEIDHAWVFDSSHRPVRLEVRCDAAEGRPVGGIAPPEFPLEDLRAALAGLPFADEAFALVERAYRPGESMGSAFAAMIRDIFAPYGLLLIDPMQPAVRRVAAPLMKRAVEQMPELIAALTDRSRELVERGYHAQVLVDNRTSLAFLLEGGRRIALKRTAEGFSAGSRKLSVKQLAACAETLSPNALLRPVIQDYLLPTAAYVGGPAELAYLAQSQVLYQKLLGRQPVAFPRAGFTLIDERSAKWMAKYRLNPPSVFVSERELREEIAQQLVPHALKHRLEATGAAVSGALDGLEEELARFDVSLAAALGTSRRKIEFQTAKIAKKTAAEIMRRDARAGENAAALHGLLFPEDHPQERLHSIVPLLAKFGGGLIADLFDRVKVECPDHQFAVV
jgi:bacillithiol biosynthesis cysteine-adding enzyme BshC